MLRGHGVLPAVDVMVWLCSIHGTAEARPARFVLRLTGEEYDRLIAEVAAPVPTVITIQFRPQDC